MFNGSFVRLGRAFQQSSIHAAFDELQSFLYIIICRQILHNELSTASSYGYYKLVNVFLFRQINIFE